MSVTELLRDPSVRDMLDGVLPRMPAKVDVPLHAPPVSKRYGLVGTAFDYALRFELQRRHPNAHTKAWVAESSLQALLMRPGSLEDAPSAFADAVVDWSKAKGIVEAAREAVTAYLEESDPGTVVREEMVAHAIRLARLDVVYRAGLVDPEMDVAHKEDVEDIMRLLDIAPYEQLGSDEGLHLNPTFGPFSEMVGGADADAISGGVLIDFKATKSPSLAKDYRRQLLSYVILARAAKANDPAFPGIEAIGVYFARHGHLWTAPVTVFTENAEFEDVSAAYLKHAANVYGGSKRKTWTDIVDRIRKAG